VWRGTHLEMNQCYVYELRLDGRVFYVGKGTGKRLTSHHQEARLPRATARVYRKIRKIWRQGQDFEAVKVREGLSHEEAFRVEIELIAKYGRRNLCNLTDGGEGGKGYKPSKESRRKMSVSQTGKIVTDETRERLSEALKGFKHSEETRQRMRDAAKRRALATKRTGYDGHRISDETRKKMADSYRGFKHSEESRAKMSKAKTGVKASEYHAARIKECWVERRNRPLSKTQSTTILTDTHTGQSTVIHSNNTLPSVSTLQKKLSKTKIPYCKTRILIVCNGANFEILNGKLVVTPSP